MIPLLPLNENDNVNDALKSIKMTMTSFLSSENCPACFEAPKERQRIKQLLAQQELLFPRLYWNLKTALFPVMRIDRTGLESVVFGRAIADATEVEDDEEEDGL